MKTDKITGLIKVVFLGTIGSGIWAVAGEPALSWGVDSFIWISQQVNNEYYDRLHAHIGKGFEDYSRLLNWILKMLVIAFVISMPFLLHYLRFHLDISDEEDQATDESDDQYLERLREISKSLEEKRKSLKTVDKFLYGFWIIYALVMAPNLISNLVISEYNHKAILFTERSIEIISPKLEAAEILQLRANYRSVSNAQDFYELYDEMQLTANSHKIPLPEFDIAR